MISSSLESVSAILVEADELGEHDRHVVVLLRDRLLALAGSARPPSRA